jgi:hypothetical protein
MIPVMIWLFFIIDKLYTNSSDLRPLKPPNQKQIIDLKEIIYFLNFGKSALYTLTAILTIFERRAIRREIKDSPLLEIDENLTEEIYKNILQQSKNPNDHDLLQTYRQLVERRKMTVTHNSNSLDNSALMLSKDPQSINNLKDSDASLKKGKENV